MPSTPLTLLLYYVGFGYVLFLLWVAVLADASKTNPPPWTRRATNVLQIIGFAHPAAAVAAWDLRRELARDRNDANASATRFPVLVVVSIAIAAALITVTQT